MSKRSSSFCAELIEEKRKLLYCIAQCSTDYEQHENINFDIPQVALMLQLMGFQLKSFEKTIDVETNPNNDNKDVITVELMCPTSGLKSVLTKQINSCQCPPETETAACEFWNVCGVQPSAREQITKSNSSLLPKISQARAKIINTLLSNIFQIIDRTETDMKETDNKKTNATYDGILMSRTRSLDGLKNHGDASIPQKSLKRTFSWEVDPNTSPPTNTSSPIPALCKSLNKISLDSSTGKILCGNLKSIKSLVEESIQIITKGNSTYTKENGEERIVRKKVSDIKPTEGPSSSDLMQFSSPLTKRKTPRKIITPTRRKLEPINRKPGTPIQSRIAMLTKKTPNKITLVKQTTMGGGSCESIFRSKLAGCIGSQHKVASQTKNSEAGTSGIVKPKFSTKTSNMCIRKK